MNPVEQTFAVYGDVSLTLDIFGPTAPSNETAVLLLHGGGWRAGDRSRMHPYARRLAGWGYTAIAVQYRLLDKAAWPAALDDVVAAVSWVRSHAAEFGVRDDRIVLEGFSAGAHLALLAAGQNSAVAAVVAFFPPTRLAIEPMGATDTDAKLLFGPGADPKAAEAASPITLVHSKYPPTMFLHGSADWLVSPEASRAMHDRLIAAGAKSELHVFADQHHEFCAITSMIAPTQDLVADFLRRTVVASVQFAEEMLRENPFAKGPQTFPARR